ncbi:uncharacterized protein LOC111119718 isoform X2 [Crassostrea virginica]
MFALLFYASFIVLVQGQCYKNSTCECHCEVCSSGCQSCLLGWSGSPSNLCQKENTLYQFYGVNSKDSKLLDGDKNTSEENDDKEPFMLVQLKNSTTIKQLFVHLELENGNNYQAYVKSRKTQRVDSVRCGTYTHNECSNGTFGEQCEYICSNACSDQCDKDTGDCVCKMGFWGKHCDKPCPSLCKDSKCNSKSGDCIDCYPGTYGQHCQNNCSQGCSDRCNPSTGVCTCKQGYFLANCSRACSENCSDSGCSKENGICLTCLPGNYGPMCDLKCLGECGGECNKITGKCGSCAKTKYGSFCNKTCPVTCEAAVCERDTGECEVCKQGFWGDRCSKNCSINCEGGTCDKNFGECRQCKRGFWGGQCSETCSINCEICTNEYKCLNCSDGWYGITCEKPCPKHCGNSRSCHKVTGNCQLCSLGYFGNTCTQNCSQYCDPTGMCNQDGKCKNCKAGRKGEYCTEMCSVQCKNSTCFRNESCVNGCEDGWFGSKCADKCKLEITNCAKCKGIDDEVICQRCFDSLYLKDSKCYKCPQNCVSCKSDEKCFQCEDNLFHGVTCNLTCDSACINKTCDITGNCIHGCEKKKYGSNCNQDCPTECKTCQNSSFCLTCEDGFEGPSCSSRVNGTVNNIAGCDGLGEECTSDAEHGIIIPVVLGMVPLLCLAPLLLMIGLLKHKWKRRGVKSKTENTKVLDSKTKGPHEISVYVTRGSVALLEEIDHSNNVINDDIIKEVNHVHVKGKISRISTSNLWEYTLKNTANGNFHTEFQELPNGLLMRATEAKKAENKKRNRYKHIYPYDINRVVLAAENEESCYINASFVNGFEKPKEYIAAQGPFTDETVVDFWRMVWEQRVNTIVILTNFVENGVTKCKEYWPSTEKTYGSIEVNKVSSRPSNFYTVCCFQIMKENQSRDLELFHFTAWPDKGVPSNVNSILDFRRRVKTKSAITGPIVVHCSAGIGRTGTYIALDYLINQGQIEKRVDVISCVSNLRNQRAHLVQTVEQYIYLYGALTKELTGKQSMVREGEFLSYYKKLKIPNPDTGKTDLEEEFNLIEKLLPGVNEIQCQAAKDINNRPKNRYSNILAGDNHRVYLNGEGSDYINAVFLPSAQHQFGYIITNTPMDNTVEDFLSMVDEQEVCTIVQLTDDDEIEGWTGNCRFTPTSEKQRFDSFDLQSYQFHNKQVVHLYTGHLWNGKRFVPSGHRALASLVDAVLEERRNHSGSPVLVVCQNGAERSGLFCVLANLVEQLHLYRSVDVLQTVLNVRHRRSQVVPCMEQLEYIYDFIDNYLKMQNGEHVDEIVYFNEPNGLV